MIKKISLKDIALRVGVSTALVSYVLNNQEKEKRVGKVIAKKIRRTAKELNYQPNQIAKSLKTRKTHTIGLIMASINYRFTYGITRAIEAEAKKNNYIVIFGSSDESHVKFKELMNALINRQVDGLILVAVENSENQIEYLRKNEVPFVLIDREFPKIQTNFIGLNNYKAAYKCVTHLIITGHTRIMLINYKTSLFHLQERNRGYFQAMKDHKLPVNLSWHKEIRGKYVEKDIQKSIKEIVSRSTNCDAIFFATDTLAIIGLKNIKAFKLKVPDDLAVVSFDESEVFELFYCPITHARQPLEQMGKMAVDMLIKVMNNKNFCEQFYFESDFYIEKSCGEK